MWKCQGFISCQLSISAYSLCPFDVSYFNDAFIYVDYTQKQNEESWYNLKNSFE